MDNRGISIAEGDILVLCIRLFSELLQSRYSLPQPTHNDALISRHSSHIFSTFSSMLASFPGGHKDENFNNLIIARSEAAILALGCAMAYSFALDEGVPRPLLDLFECFVTNLDAAWYTEHASVTEGVRRRWEDEAARVALSSLPGYIDALAVRPWITAPIISDDAWNCWIPSLTTHKPAEVREHSSSMARL